MSAETLTVLTSAANVAGYTLLLLLTVYGLRALDRRQVGPVPAAALALFLDWVLVTVWYVSTIYWIESYPHGGEPGWLEATSGIAENIQSEVIQIWIAALVFKHLIWRGTPESKE